MTKTKLRVPIEKYLLLGEEEFDIEDGSTIVTVISKSDNLRTIITAQELSKEKVISSSIYKLIDWEAIEKGVD